MSELKMKYFVLKPAGNNPYAKASRIAMRAYAHAIAKENDELHIELLNWADREASLVYARMTPEEAIKIIAQTNTAWQNDQFSQFFKDWDNSIATIEPEDKE